MPVRKRHTALSNLLAEQHRRVRGVAQEAGIGEPRFYALLNGTRQMKADEAVRLAAILGVPIEAVIGVREPSASVGRETPSEVGAA